MTPGLSSMEVDAHPAALTWRQRTLPGDYNHRWRKTVMKTRPVAGILLSLILCSLTVAVSSSCGEETTKKKPPKVTYEDDVLPILRQKCFTCHNADKKSGDLNLTNYSTLMLGGGSGEVVEAGDSGSSYLYMLISHESEPYMPPEQPKLPDEMIETIRKWIDGGVLETKGSKAKLKKKKTFDLALQSAPTERPKVSPMPPRLSLEPLTRTPTTTAVSAIATSPWSPIAAVAGEQQVLLYNTQSLQLVGTLPFPEGQVQILKFSRNGSLLLAGGGQGGATGKAIVWNVLTGERVFEVGDELDTVLAADISSDQTLIALGGPQRVVRIYSTESGRLLHELRKHTDWVCSLEFSPDSVLLATGDRAGGLYVWEGWTGREYLTLKAHSKCVTDVSWRSDSNVLASCSEDGSIRLWEMNNGGQIKSWGAHGGGVESIEFTRDGRIFSCGRDRVARLWDQNGGKQRDFEAFGDLALEAAFCNETNRAIAGDWTGAVRVWNAADGARVGELTPNPPTLEERLAAATKLVAARDAAYKPLAVAYQAAQATANKAQADLAAAQKASEDAKKRLDAAAAKLNAANQAMTKATQANDAATKAVATLAAGAPVLVEASLKAADAAKKLAGDKEVAELAAKLKVIATQRAAQLDTNKKVAADKAKALATAKAAAAEADKESKAADAAYKAAVANVEKLKPLVKPAADAAAAAKQKADQANAALVAAQNESKRWTDEIAFTKLLRDLTTKRSEAMKLLEQREIEQADAAEAADVAVATLQKAQAELKSYQDGVVAAQKATAAAQTELQKSKANVAAAEQALDSAAKTAATLQSVITPLTEAAAKAKDAAAKVAGDKELAAAATQLQALVDGRKKMLETVKADVLAKTKAVEVAKQTVAAAEKKAAAANAALATVQKQSNELAAAMKPLEGKASEAQAAVEAAGKPVAEAQKVVDDLKTKIAAAKGIKTA